MRADAIVVLGCRFDEDGRPSPAAARRAARAARAFAEGDADRIVCSGGRRWGPVVEAVAMREALVGLGVPREATALELASLTTLENARFTAALLRRGGLSRVALVTCDFHGARAQRSFQAFGLEVTLALASSPALAPWARARRGLQEVASGLLDRGILARMPVEVRGS